MAGVSLARRVYLWAARVFVASVLFQGFAIGLYLFAGFDISLHLLGALVVFVMSIVVFVSSLAAGTSGRSKGLAGGLIVLTIVQGLLAGFKYSDTPAVGALHPLNAFLLFWLGLVVLRDAQACARMPVAPAAHDASPAEAPAGPS